MFQPVDKKGFERIGDLVEGMERCGRKATGNLAARLSAPGSSGTPDNWTVDSAWAFEEQNPAKGRGLIYAIAVTLIALLVWAGVAPIDEVVSGTGKAVAPSGTQPVQSVDGGVVEAILVKEAERVEKGRVLLRLDPVRVGSMLGQQHVKLLTLRVRAARLEALSSGTPFAVSEDLIQAIPDIVASERKLYETSRQEIASRMSVIRDQNRQRQQELADASARYSHADQSYSLAVQELDITRPLLESGAVPKLEVMRLEKAAAQAKADRSQASAQISRIKASIQEGEGQIKELKFRSQAQWRNQLSETLGEMEGLAEGNRALSDRIVHAEVRSPIAGTVKRLSVNSTGAVIMPGGLVAEIVPDEQTLFVEAQLSPKDRAFIRPGQEAVVKFTAYEYAVYGGIDGTIDSITPDTITDERGNTYYRGRVRIDKSDFGKDLPILPGMVAQVDIKTGRRTILSYLLRPLLRAKSSALRER